MIFFKQHLQHSCTARTNVWEVFPMLSNKSFAPGLLAGSKEYSYHATKVARELLLYVEFTGHQYVSPEYVLMRSHYCHYLLMHVVSGCIVYETDGCSGEARAGQAILMETQITHVYGSIGNSEISWIHFNGADFHPLFEYIISANNGSHTFDVSSDQEFVAKMNDLVQSYGTSNLYPEVIAAARLTELFGLLLSGHSGSSMEIIQSSIRYIKNHYSEPITLNQIARQAGLSVSRFSTLFKKETGYTPYQYILFTRLHASRQLLTGTISPIHEIAAYTGFSDASAYIAAFRKKYNCTPLQYRAKNSSHSELHTPMGKPQESKFTKER